MKNLLIFFILLTFFSSCNKAKSSDNNLTDKKLDSILDSNSKEFVFMNFYPNIEYGVYNELIARNISKGLLFKKEIDKDYFEPYYKMELKNQEIDFMLMNIPNGIELYSYSSFTKNKSKGYPTESNVFSKKSEYQKAFNEILIVFKEKYGNYSTYENEKRETIYSFNNLNKVILIRGKFSGLDYNGYQMNEDGDITYASYLISIKFYSEKSYNKLKENAKLEKSKNLEEQKNEKERKRRIEKEKKNKLLNDI